jgi:mRNA interferase RelE/StbE
MEKYKITFKKSVSIDLKFVPKSDVKKILLKVDSLAVNLRREGAVKLNGQEMYRIRQGLYRIIYEIRDSELVIQVIKIGHRSDVYKRT